MNVFYYPISLRAPQFYDAQESVKMKVRLGEAMMLPSWVSVSFTTKVIAECSIYINLLSHLLANVGGVFLVLGFGCLFALIVAIIEFLWNVKKVAVEERVRSKRWTKKKGQF